jgi:hypothetical protein
LPIITVIEWWDKNGSAQGILLAFHFFTGNFPQTSLSFEPTGTMADKIRSPCSTYLFDHGFHAKRHPSSRAAITAASPALPAEDLKKKKKKGSPTV